MSTDRFERTEETVTERTEETVTEITKGTEKSV